MSGIETQKEISAAPAPFASMGLAGWLDKVRHTLTPDQAAAAERALLALRFTDESSPVLVRERDKDLRAFVEAMGG